MKVEWSRQAGTPTSPNVLEQRLSIIIHRISAKLPHSSKLEPTNPVGPWRIPTELPCSSYEEGSRQAESPSGPQSLATLPKRLRLATTLGMGSLQVESPKCVVCSDFHLRGVFIGPWESSTDLAEAVTHQVVVGRLVRWNGFHYLSPSPWPSSSRVDMCSRSHGPNRLKTWPAG
jgi:hypothetical protein